jgi:hypothetical protein
MATVNGQVDATYLCALADDIEHAAGALDPRLRTTKPAVNADTVVRMERVRSLLTGLNQRMDSETYQNGHYWPPPRQVMGA